MPTSKQLIYCRLLQEGILRLRMLCSWGSNAKGDHLNELHTAFEIGWEEANFLHRIQTSILEPEYVDNDLTFINWAFPAHVERLGDQLTRQTAALMLAFYEGVPDHLRAELTWHPDAKFRQLAAQTHGSS